MGDQNGAGLVIHGDGGKQLKYSIAGTDRAKIRSS